MTNSVTTDIVIKLINDLIKIYGKPKQILTDNGSTYGSKSEHSKFDRKLRLGEFNTLEDLFITQQLREKLKDYFKLSNESLSFVMKIHNSGE